LKEFAQIKKLWYNKKVNLFPNKKSNTPQPPSALKPIKRYEGERGFFPANAKGNKLAARHMLFDAVEVDVTRSGPYIPLLKRDITKLNVTNESVTQKQLYAEFFQSMDQNGHIVSFEETLDRIDDESFDNLIFHNREHRHFHLNSFNYPDDLSAYIIDFSMLVSGLSKTDKNSKSILSEELRLDTASLLGHIEKDVAFPSNPKTLETSIPLLICINTILMFEFLKKIVPDLKITSWLEEKTKEYLQESIQFPPETIDQVLPVFKKFKEAFAAMKASDFGPNYPSVEKEREHEDYYMARDYLSKQGFFEYIDNFENEVDLNELFGFMVQK
jgi:hypothetical protein